MTQIAVMAEPKCSGWGGLDGKVVAMVVAMPAVWAPGLR